MKRHDVQIEASNVCPNCGHKSEPTQMLVAILTDGDVSSKSNTVEIDAQGEPIEPQKRKKFLGNNKFPQVVLEELEHEQAQERTRGEK